MKKDMVGRNARIKSLIKMTGLMLTGASGFFKAAGSAATYNRSINIYNDPFQKGLELCPPQHDYELPGDFELRGLQDRTRTSPRIHGLLESLRRPE